MAKVLVSYFSFTGKTKQLAEAAAEGASNAGAVVEIKESINTTVQDLVDADVWLVATPQTFGTMAAETKRMFERLYVARNELTKASVRCRGLPRECARRHAQPDGQVLQRVRVCQGRGHSHGRCEPA